MITDWLDFSEEIRTKNRFFPQNTLVLQQVDEMVNKHIEIIDDGSIFYRARLIGIEEMRLQNGTLLGFPNKESMSPEAQLASAQRASPERITYLYVAQDEYTALSEIRPGIFSFISLAEIKSIEKLKIFSLWVDLNENDLSSEHSQLAISFSAVISEKEKGIDYLPMQFIAEYVKNKGVDGISYPSFQSAGGKNFVIFSKEKVEFVKSKVMYNQNTTYSFLDMNNPEKSQRLITQNRTYCLKIS